MNRASPYRRAAFAAASLLAALACGVADPVAPGSVFRSDSPSSDRLSQRQPAIARCSSSDAVAASGVFGPQGGVLRFGASSLVIPAGALSGTARISVTPRHDQAGIVDFQPEGLRFHRPVKLMLSAMGCAVPADGVPAIVYLGADGGILETIAATYDRRRNQVVAPIVHFSGYGIAF